jgi:LytR cell envelope-related transcriptional attenuator
MQTIPFAVSVHHFISSVGADAGFAALVAVALLILLYFSHARETATLRHRADETAQRVEKLEAELAALADHVAALPAEISVHAVSPRPAPAFAGAHVPAGVGRTAFRYLPAAPAGVGAPALAAATKLIPDPEQVGQHEPATVGLVDRPVDGDAPGQIPRPVTVGGNGSSPGPLAAAATIHRSARPAPGGPSRPGSGPPRAAQGRSSGPQGRRPGGPPPQTMATRTAARRTRTGTVLMVLAAVLGVGAVVSGVVIITNLHNSSSASRSSAATGTVANHGTANHLPAVVPSTVTVSVLNGTDTSELARTVSDRLSTSGYKKGYVGNYGNSQTKTSSTVEYMRGDKREAAAVAAALKLPPTSLRPIDTATQQIACPPANGPCTSAVIVTVGSNLAGLATATATP